MNNIRTKHKIVALFVEFVISNRVVLKKEHKTRNNKSDTKRHLIAQKDKIKNEYGNHPSERRTIAEYSIAS